MVTLKLNIDALGDLGNLDRQANTFSSFLSDIRTKVPRFKWLSTPPTAVPEGFHALHYMIFLVFCDFLQPESSLSTSDAVNCILKAFPGHEVDYGAIIIVCLELAAQIPYHHPSQQKLARLLWCMGRSTERLNQGGWNNGELEAFYQTLGIDLTDANLQPREESDPEYSSDRFVNYVAFVANVLAIGIFRPWSRTPLSILSRALERRHNEETPEVRDAWVLGAAQLVLWHGQGLFKLVLSPEDLVEDDKVPRWLVGEPEEHGPIELERWVLWRDRFNEVAGNETYGAECRDVAKKAAEIMDVIKRSMLFKV
ncbi:hypothetical protein QBC33DRAFT_571765 [Phialemonium atrogriseum]|uniref:Uncharacterized protein n=1 Tax=Phialemonium atrogriseum TaxID=1093897 RepID=A0AAJ0C017_9PEZI|nr:uncharacterized protein QBC33DRAFT_571765 [Phialemonium atrogriseum]KAK1765201.1 hypothetical protein QBC33DRAFT_571765 [Phialemonium atrogriseum]